METVKSTSLVALALVFGLVGSATLTSSGAPHGTANSTPSESCDQFELAWKPLHYRIFASRAELRQEPDKTHAMMEELLLLYENLSCAKLDKGAKVRADKLRPLVAVSAESDPTENRCAWTKLARLNQLIDYNQPFKVNVIPYLESHRDLLLASCLDNYEKELSQTLAKAVTPDDTHQIGQDFFTAINSIKARANHRKSLVGNLLGLIERRSDLGLVIKPLKVKSKTKTPEFLTISELGIGYDQLVAQACHLFKHKLKGLLSEQFHLLHGRVLSPFQSQDDTINKWLGYSHACLELIEDEKEIKRELVLANIMSERRLSHL